MVVPSNPLRREVGSPHQCPLGVGSKLPLPLYADVRLHIPMTHNHGRPMVPESIDYISVDRYNTNGTVEEESDRAWYNGRIYPKLHPHQGVFLVPGIFASDPVNCLKNNVSCPLEDQAEQIVNKLQDFLVWAQEDYKVVGFNPWHFNNRTVNQGYIKGYDDRLGAVSMPSVVDKLQEIGTYIMNMTA